MIERPADPRFAGASEIALAADPKFLEKLAGTKARAAILPIGVDWSSYGLDAAIFIGDARRGLLALSHSFEIPWSRHWKDAPADAHPLIDASANIADDAIIGPFSLIGEECQIGKGSIIHDHVSIAQNVRIGARSEIYPGVRIGPGTIIGEDAIIMSNSVIGADGFSYLTPNAEAINAARGGGDAAGMSGLAIERIHSLGAVHIGDRVEIGANCSIDRGTLRDTKIGAGTKIDNLVHIGHNVQIGENCLICGQVGIAGSAEIGDRVILGGQVGVADNVKIGSDVIAAGKSALSSSVRASQTVMGNPAIKMRENIANYRAWRRLPALVERVRQLEKALTPNARRSKGKRKDAE